MLEYADNIWDYLNKYNLKNALIYQEKILSLTLSIILNSLASDRRNFLFLIFDGIADTLHKENAIDKLKDGGGDPSISNKYLEEIMIKCQDNKTISNFLKDRFKCIFQKVQDTHFKSLFGNYRENLENMEDENLKEY